MSVGDTGGQLLDNGPIDVRVKLAALWAAVMFVFAYVDIFAFFRADVVNGVLAGKTASFQVDQTFLLLTTLYVAIPSVMVFLSLVLRPAVNRWVSIVLAVVYVVSIAASCVGETWLYYFAGSAVECVLLVALAWTAWTWPRRTD
jgi:hypothetical protein